MINTNDEQQLRSVYKEMNLGFAAPTNGGVDNSAVVVLKNDDQLQDGTCNSHDNEEPIGDIINAVIEDLSHIKMDLDQACEGDAQITCLQACVDKLNTAIECIGNSSSNSQDSAYTGLNNQDPNGNDPPSANELGAIMDNPV
jgi:hypothetical protein